MKKLIWLASFPKSGNTWVRAFLAAYHFQLATQAVLDKIKCMTESESRFREFAALANNPREELTEREIDSLRAAVQHRLTRSVKPYQLIKTHNARLLHNGCELICREFTRGAVYVVRNPLDVVNSYADHANLTIDGAIDLMNDPGHSIGNPESTLVTQYLRSWSTHVRSWTCHGDFPVHVVRYEDLQSFPAETFRGLVHFLRWELDDDRLQQAIENSSFDMLRRTEASSGFDEQSDVAKSRRFFRRGKSNGWRDVLTPAQAGRIVENHGEVMRQLGYEMSLEKSTFREGEAPAEPRNDLNDTAQREFRSPITISRNVFRAEDDPRPLKIAIECHQAGNLTEARALYEKILEADVDNAHAWHLLGVVCQQAGEHARAMELIDKAIALQPANGIFYSNRAAACLAARDWQQAETDYRRALELDDRLADAHNGLAIAFNATDRPLEAIEHFQLAVQHRPAFPEAHKNLGNALARQGRHKEALTHLKKAIELRPSFADAHASLAQLLAQMGDQ